MCALKNRSVLGCTCGLQKAGNLFPDFDVATYLNVREVMLGEDVSDDLWSEGSLLLC